MRKKSFLTYSLRGPDLVVTATILALDPLIFWLGAAHVI